MCIWPSQSLSCNTSSVTCLLLSPNFFLCLFCLFSPIVQAQDFLCPVSLFVSLSSLLSFTLYFSSLSLSFPIVTFYFYFLFSLTVSLLLISPSLHRSPLTCLSPLPSYRTDISRLYNLCVAPLGSSTSYLIFHDMLPTSERGKYAGL